MSAPKLTKAQLYMLEVAGEREQVCGLRYKPAAALRDAGLIVLRMIGPHLAKVEITPAGRAYLEEHGG